MNEAPHQPDSVDLQALQSAEAPAALGPEAVHTMVRFPRLRVLVAEDDGVSQLLIELLLQRMGCVVQHAGNGKEAVALWEAGGMDLVLMDMQMPVMGGAQATQYIRQAEAARSLPRTPIVAVTADALQGDQAVYLGQGFDSYASKPIVVSQLVDAMEQALGRPTGSTDGLADPLMEGLQTPAPPRDQQTELGAVLGVEGSDLQSLFKRIEFYLAQDMALLIEAHEARSLDQVLLATHRLKGSLGFISAERALRLCRSVEMTARSGDWALCARTLHLLQQAVSAAVAEAMPSR